MTDQVAGWRAGFRGFALVCPPEKMFSIVDTNLPGQRFKKYMLFSHLPYSAEALPLCKREADLQKYFCAISVNPVVIDTAPKT